jgi:hypothetical protein
LKDLVSLSSRHLLSWRQQSGDERWTVQQVLGRGGRKKEQDRTGQRQGLNEREREREREKESTMETEHETGERPR